MEKLGPDFRIDENALDKRLSSIASEIERERPDDENIRRRILKAGFEIKRVTPKPPKEAGFLAADSSFAKKELRFNVLWGVHAACVYGVFDGRAHADSMIGQGSVPYRNLAYESETDFGLLKPYSNVDARIDAIRVGAEAKLLNEIAGKIQGEGLKLDCVLFDGSLTTLEVDGDAKEAAAARRELARLKSMDVVGIVEDSHDTDISKQLGFEYTNAMIFEAALTPLEYVAQQRGGFSVCYIKLPGKRLPHLGGGLSQPSVARWEFKAGNEGEHLPEILGVWMSEDDIHHPQIYPIRVADYLTRRINVSSILEDFAVRNSLAPQFRSMREA